MFSTTGTLKFAACNVHNNLFWNNVFTESITNHEYSTFKYGSKTAARKMGRILAQNFDNEMENLLSTETINRQFVVAPSPFNFIPTATFALKDYFLEYFNRRMIGRGLKPLQETKVTRQHSYNEDYSSMTIEQRREAISSESFHMDREFVRDKFVIFLDDIRITGAHEERMQEMVDRLNLEDVNCKYIYMYFGELTEDVNPDIESYLNHYTVKDLLDINDIIANDGFQFNTRVVKFILSAQPEECETFLRYQSQLFLRSLCHYAVGNSYYNQSEFIGNFKTLESLIR